MTRDILPWDPNHFTEELLELLETPAISLCRPLGAGCCSVRNNDAQRMIDIRYTWNCKGTALHHSENLADSHMAIPCPGRVQMQWPSTTLQTYVPPYADSTS